MGKQRAIGRDWAGHPVGLAIVTVAEAVQAAGVYGVQALLILYMANFLFTPAELASVGGFAAWRGLLEGVFGPMSLQALATQTMGLYLGLFFLTPLLGGWLGDRFWGPRLACIIGAAVATAGLVMVIMPATFLPGLMVSAFGAGALRCNLKAQTGHLYARNDGRRDAAFSILALGLNTGAFLGPLLIGALGERVNWQWGFAAASGCMALAAITLVIGNGLMPPDTPPEARRSARLQPGDGRTIAALLVVMLFTSLFWLAQSQVWNVYALWGRDHLDRIVLGFDVPVTWLQAFDSLAPILAVPPVLALWRWQAARGREPKELGKIGIGLALMGGAFLWLAAGSGAAQTPILWAVVFHFVLNTGWLYLVPTIDALFSRTAPLAVTGVMLGGVQFGVFIGSTMSGWLGRFYETMDVQAFWVMHAAFPLAGAAIMWLVRGRLGAVLKL
ncbi:MFS transporter [Sandarakinorhabdus sp.]|uniref:peptide MFS transporter n=1 Tax=Sandarakinorhabdus sp. TaxID=1916663 RepID=UPI00286E1405|nr:MFS transporter [Sandarakinorhabdus sp.]